MRKYSLCVPMMLNALVVNDYVREHQPFRRHKLDYLNLDRFDSPEPPPFGNLEEPFRNDPNNNGIYLHWNLPSGFTQVSQEKGKPTISYPLVPNRWLVIRKQHDVENSRYDAAWVVVSDRTWRNASHGSPFRSYRADQGMIASIGDKVPLSQWEEHPFPSDLFLSADGCGDFSFSAFQPSCQNVFSIHDKLEGFPEDTEVNLDYTVLGWFSNTSSDPLHDVRSSDQLELILNRYKWKHTASRILPRRTLLKGEIEQVRWIKGNDPARLPRTVHPNQTVTVGLTSTDAICELLGNFHDPGDTQLASQLMEIFQYGQLQALEDIGGEETIDDAIHRSGFRSNRGGLIWKLVKRGEVADSTSSTTYIDEDKSYESSVLAELNVLQKNTDKISREILTRQQQLYESWWKYKKKPESREGRELIRIEQEVLLLLQTRDNQLAPAIYILVQKIQYYLQQIGNKKQLIYEDMPRFWSPNDPVVMISGFNKQVNSPARPDTECLVFQFEDNFTENEQQNLPQFVSAALQFPLPDDLKQLWEQPWKPLFLEWEVEWKPIPYTDSNWQFDGRELQCSMNPTTGIMQTFSGRTFLGSHAVFSIKDRLQHYVDHHPEPARIPQALKEFISRMEDLDVLSQTLGGLHRQLLQRDPRMHPTPDDRSDDDDVTRLLENQSTSMSFIDSILENSEESLFQPIRCGHMVIKRLTVVDAYGQINEVEITPASTFIAESMRTLAEDLGVAELKPRVVQGARLNFNWVSAHRDQEELNYSPSVQPICGWVLPNHLERGLSIYDPEGKILGDIKLNGRLESSPTADWEPAPQVNSISNPAWRDRHPHLERFINGLTHAPDQANALSSLLPVVDETIWVINPKKRSFDQSLSVLMGRPLVMARAKLSLELEGARQFHPKFFPYGGHQPSYITKQFKVKLGNVFSPQDGLIGYFLNDDYNKFYSVYRPSYADSPYIEEIGPNNYIKLNLKNQLVYVTLLFDPNASIFAYSDVVPTKELILPEKYHTESLKRMEVFFRTGPILTTVLDRAPEANRIIMPIPHLTKGEWTWYERSRENYDNWDALIPIDEDKKELPRRESPTLREGLLKLKLIETQPSPGP